MVEEFCVLFNIFSPGALGNIFSCVSFWKLYLSHSATCLSGLEFYVWCEVGVKLYFVQEI